MTNTYLDILMKSITSENEVLTFLHNAPTKEAAENILKEGFLFNSHIDYSTDNVSAKDEVTVKYFTLTRQAYGNYTIIIQIARSIIEKYSSILENTPHHFSEVLTVAEPYPTVDDEFIYQLAPQFVKGYIYSQEYQLVLNSKFDPNCDCAIFEKNLEQILNGLRQNNL